MRVEGLWGWGCGRKEREKGRGGVVREGSEAALINLFKNFENRICSAKIIKLEIN